MEVVKKDTGKLSAEIAIKIQEKDYKDQVEKSLKNYRKQVNLPGFRKGMVPMGMVKKMVGTNILVEEINRLLSSKLQSYITDEKMEILGNPLPKEEEAQAIDWESQKEFDFTYEIGLAPEVKISLSDKDKFDKYNIQIADKMLNEQMDEIAKRYGKMVPADVSAEGDMLYGKFEELEKGKVKEDGISNSTVLNIATIDNKKEQKKLIGLKAGDSVSLKVAQLASENYVASWLGIDVSEVKDIKSDFNFTVEKINRMEAAEYTQELFDKIYGEGVVKSKDEFKAKIKEEMEKSFAENAEQLFERDVQDHLIKKAKLDLPDDFMKRWLMTANEKPVTKEQIEEDYEDYARGLKWQLIENKLIKENGLELNQDEVVEHTKGLINQQLAGMGQMMDDKELTETAMRVLSNQEEARRVYDQLYSVKLRKHYNETVKIKERNISYDDFVKLVEKKKK
ncbi:MAG: trigger factor [Flavobacteriales bacterium]|nr:trigger factor [Flavobacteriales bacterium]|tara:strand:- start:275 stop:1627 length:1353 start_codon:yes stop_codon:yes gene_type:complete